MILDSYVLHSVVFQIQYPGAYAIWDRSGAVAHKVTSIYPGLKLADAQPQQQTLRGAGVEVQTSFDKGTVTLRGSKTLDQRKIRQLAETFEVWKQELALRDLTRVSARCTYTKKFPSMLDANRALFSLGLVRWPTQRVFDQPPEGNLNSFDLAYRFEDETLFSLIRVRTERLKYDVDLDPDFVDEPRVSETLCRAVIDFDRGNLGFVDATKLRIEDWFKGYFHVMRRDLDKVLKTNHE